MNKKEFLLRNYIRSLIIEAYASNVDGPHVGSASVYHPRISISPHLAQRDEIPYLGKRRKKDDEEIAAHLMEPEVDMEDCYGPVPPDTEEPGVYSDPYTSDYHVIPKADYRR